MTGFHLPAVGRAGRACRHHAKWRARSGSCSRSISPGYGFTAIIVAFLGRLNPIGILIAGFVIALSYLGGEAIQVELGSPTRWHGSSRECCCSIVLACDALILYRIRLAVCRGCAAEAPAHALRAIILTIITAATPLLLAAIGELVVERSGVLNLGVEGMMVMGAVVAASPWRYVTGSPLLGVWRRHAGRRG